MTRFVPTTHVEFALLAGAMAAWIVFGVVATLGGIDWSLATFLGFVFSAPLLVYRTFIMKDED